MSRPIWELITRCQHARGATAQRPGLDAAVLVKIIGKRGGRTTGLEDRERTERLISGVVDAGCRGTVTVSCRCWPRWRAGCGMYLARLHR